MSDVWRSPGWRAEAEHWLAATLEAHGIEQTGEIEQPRVRFWSTQLTVPTDRGLLWFKENNPGQAFEAALVGRLAEIAPEHVVVPIAVEAVRGWLLSPDQGPTLASLPATDQLAWARVVTDFADLQRRVSGHRDELIATGLSPLPPDELAAYLDEQVAALRRRPVGDPRRVDEELADRVRRSLPWLSELGDRLCGGPVPLSLEHNDLHHNNTFLPGSADEPLRFFDFGDALWAHPFTTLRITLNVLAEEWAADIDDPRVRYVIDAYLDGWGDLGTRAELRELLDAALALGPAHRFVSWQRVLDFADDDELADFGGSPAAWLGILVGQV